MQRIHSTNPLPDGANSEVQGKAAKEPAQLETLCNQTISEQGEDDNAADAGVAGAAATRPCRRGGPCTRPLRVDHPVLQTVRKHAMKAITNVASATEAVLA